MHHTQGQTHTHCPEDLPAGPVRVCVYGVCSCCRACQETGKKIRERISVQKSAKLVLLTLQRIAVVRAFLNPKGHQTVLNCCILGKGLGTREHFIRFWENKLHFWL